MIKIEISDDGESKIEIKCKDELELFKNLERLHCEIVNFSASNIKDYLDVARNALAKSANQFAFFQTRAMTGYDDLLTRFTDYGALVESEMAKSGKKKNTVTKDDKKKYKVEMYHFGKIVTKELSLVEIKKLCKSQKKFCVNYIGMDEKEKKAVQGEIARELEKNCSITLPILSIIFASISIISVVIGFLVS